MANVYFVDTSALGKRYIVETGSGWLQGILDPTTGCTVILVRTTMVEMISAITRREMGRDLYSDGVAIFGSIGRAVTEGGTSDERVGDLSGDLRRRRSQRTGAWAYGR